MAQAFYSPITVQGSQVPSTQSNFPVPYFQTDARFKTIGNGGHVANANGYDIRPYSDAALTTPLTYELVPDTYNASTGFFEMWVLISSLADASTIYFGYGDASLTTDGSSSSTWPSQFAFVHHWANGSSLSVLDSTSNAKDGTNSGATATSGQVDGAVNFVAASSQEVSGGELDALSGLTACSLSFWFKRASISTKGPGPIARIAGTNFFGAEVYQDGNIYLDIDNNTEYGYFASNDTSWHYLLMVFDGSLSGNSNRLKAWMDGAQMTLSFDASTIGSSLGTITAGTTHFGKIGIVFESGSMDETAGFTTAVTGNWGITAYNSQSNNPAFWALGTEVAVGGGSIVPILDNLYRQRRAA